MIVGVVKETFPGERRVALIPAILPTLAKAGIEVHIEAGAGTSAGFPDAQYLDKGAKLVLRNEALAAGVLLQVRSLGANPQLGHADLESLRKGQIVIGMCDPLGMPEESRVLAERGVTLFSLELIPRTTRAQSMDVLSSMATIAGYRAVLIAALHLPKMFPMLTTAAGTITPAKVFIMGAGVAGLQAIASARRLGAVVSANDVRSAVKEQVQSLGAKFVEVPVEQSAEGQGGYAKAMDEEFYRRQRELLGKTVAESDVVITTALIPGKPAPKLVTADMVHAMQPGSVVIDLAAERGGNCELTRPGESADIGGVTILGPMNLPSEIPYHASQMFAKNITTFLLNMVKDGQLKIDTADEIVRETLISMGGKMVNERVIGLLK